MNTYKITNITNLIGKRDIKFNSTLDITYVDSMIEKTIKIKPDETIYLQISSLPLSVHRLRVKKLISVVEISDNQFKRRLEVITPQPVKTEVIDESKKSDSTASVKKKEVKTEVKPEIKKNHDSVKKYNEDQIPDIE